MSRDRVEEMAARAIVAHALPGATVTSHDDGSRDSMVDAIITYPDGRTAPLEVVTDTKPGSRQVWARIMREGGQVIDAPGLRYSWHISVEDDAQIREIRESIVALLALMEAPPGLLDLGWPDGRRWHDREDYAQFLERLGVRRATPVHQYGESPKVVVSPGATAGWAGPPDLLATWVGEFLSRTAPDVPKKLAAHGGSELHAFVWATLTTEYSIMAPLEGDGLPTDQPELPVGVSHVWIGGFYGGARVLRWRPDAGWSDVYRLPRDGRINFS